MRFIIIFTLALLISPAYSQSVFWEPKTVQTYTKNVHEQWIDVKQISPNTILFVGLKEMLEDSSQSLYLLKTDLKGIPLDSSTYPLSKSAYLQVYGSDYSNGILRVFGASGRKMKYRMQDTFLLHNFVQLMFDANLNFVKEIVQTYPISMPYHISQIGLKPKFMGGYYGAMVLQFYHKETINNIFGQELVCYFMLNSEGYFEHLLLDTFVRKPGFNSSINFYTDPVSKEIIQLSENRFLAVKSPDWTKVMKEDYRLFDSTLKEIPIHGCFFKEEKLGQTFIEGPHLGLMKNPSDPNLFFMAGKKAGINGGYFIGNFTIDSFHLGVVDTLIPSVGNRFLNVFLPGVGISNFPALNNCIDRLYDNGLVFGAMSWYSKESYGYLPNIQRDTLVLARFDKDLKTVFLRYFGNGEKITLTDVRALSDLSMLVVGYTRNQINDSTNTSKDFFALKINPNGSIQGTPELNKKSPWVQVYPNPVHGVISVRTETQMKQLVLMSFEGKILMHKNALGTEENWNVTSLPKGLYVLRIEFENDHCTNCKLIID